MSIHWTNKPVQTPRTSCDSVLFGAAYRCDRAPNSASLDYSSDSINCFLLADWRPPFYSSCLSKSSPIEPFACLHLFVTALRLILHSGRCIQPLAEVKSLSKWMKNLPVNVWPIAQSLYLCLFEYRTCCFSNIFALSFICRIHQCNIDDLFPTPPVRMQGDMFVYHIRA